MSDPNKKTDSAVATVKDTAFGICFFRSILSMLPPEAGALCYDETTPDFEGVALDFNPANNNSNKDPLGPKTLLAAAKAAKNFGGLMGGFFEKEPEKNWRGLEFNICRAHTVDQLLLDAVKSESSPIRQVVFCGVGQDYRGMRHGKALQSHGAKVFELDLEPMMELRTKIKEEICQAHEDEDPNFTDCLPETHALAIDFGSQHVSDVLLACEAFDPTVPTLYFWEGVSYYLTPEAMRSFLMDIHALMSRAPLEERQHQRLFFDHLVDLPRLVREEDDPPAKAMLEIFQNSEPLLAFLDFDKVKPYLEDLGFSIHQQIVPPDMYKPYQTADDPVYHLKESKYFGMVVVKPVAEG